MGKPKKTVKKYNYTKNRRKAWKKSKELPKIKCVQVKEAWNVRQSIARNLTNMGLSADPNSTIPIPTTKMMLSVDRSQHSAAGHQRDRTNSKVAEALEAEANTAQARTLKISDPETRYCIYMLEKYAQDYKAMAKDSKNYFQDTPKQIRRKIRTFMSIPSQYTAYLKTKKLPENMDIN